MHRQRCRHRRCRAVGAVKEIGVESDRAVLDSIRDRSQHTAPAIFPPPPLLLLLLLLLLPRLPRDLRSQE